MTEFRVNVDLNEKAVPQLQEAVDQSLDDIGDFLTSYIKKIAPVDTGEFMRSVDWVKVDDKRIIVGSSDKPGKVWALEHGHSDQAPNGVFEVGVKRNKDNIRKIFVKNVQAAT